MVEVCGFSSLSSSACIRSLLGWGVFLRLHMILSQYRTSGLPGSGRAGICLRRMWKIHFRRTSSLCIQGMNSLRRYPSFPERCLGTAKHSNSKLFVILHAPNFFRCAKSIFVLFARDGTFRAIAAWFSAQKRQMILPFPAPDACVPHCPHRSMNSSFGALRLGGLATWQRHGRLSRWAYF